MKKAVANFGKELLSREQMKKVTGGDSGGPKAPVHCWCSGAGGGWCAGDCNHCNGRSGCFPY